VNTWNYRVIIDADNNYSIREVYYNEQKEIEGWTDECAPFGENMEELRNDMEYMFQALSKEAIYETYLIEEKLEEIKKDLVIENEESQNDDNKEEDV